MSTPACRLYLITPPAIADLGAFADHLAQALDAGDVAAVQLRLKGAPDEAIATAARRLLPMCRSRDVALIVNDRPDLAAALDCDGVHVGREDAPVRGARAIVGPDRIVGATCHASRHLAMEAAEAGADYVAFGAFFATATKAAPTRAEPEILAIWQETMLTPCVAIGGITPDNCGPLVAAGADYLAVCAGVWDHPKGPAAAVRAFTAAMREAVPN